MYPTRRQDSVSALDANCLLYRVHVSRMHFESNQETNRHGLDTRLHPIRSSHATPMQIDSKSASQLESICHRNTIWSLFASNLEAKTKRVMLPPHPHAELLSAWSLYRQLSQHYTRSQSRRRRHHSKQLKPGRLCRTSTHWSCFEYHDLRNCAVSVRAVAASAAPAARFERQ
jgi:hypothetical protein